MKSSLIDKLSILGLLASLLLTSGCVTLDETRKTAKECRRQCADYTHENARDFRYLIRSFRISIILCLGNKLFI